MFTYTRGMRIEDFNCTEPAIEEFPPDGLTRQQRQDGLIAVHFFIAIYIFLALAIICEEYFVPSVERLCADLHVSTDVAGATFMAVATSAPELFVNVIGTFITEGDLGIGTIVGSAVFNTLGVAAFCGTVSGVTIKLDWWPLSRDCVIYAISISILIVTLLDAIVHWYEAATMVGFYFIYCCIMYNDRKLQKWAKANFTCSCFVATYDHDGKRDSRHSKAQSMDFTPTAHVCTLPRGENCFMIACWIIKYPLYFCYFLTIPDCRAPNLKRLYPITFIMCCLWISGMSYVCSWMITIIGDTFHIPDSVMGISFLAIGTSVPEAVTSVIVARRGYGSMAICNSIGSNTFNVLVCLGVPWLCKTVFVPTDPDHSLSINSSGLIYSTATLLTTLCLLYITFVITKFTLGKTLGCICCVLYFSFMTFATMMEMNVFFVVNLPMCNH